MTTMRIDRLSLVFHRAGPGSGSPPIPDAGAGWYISTTDADKDHEDWVDGPRKVTPTQALVIAEVFGPVSVQGVLAQNRWAEQRAAEALHRAEVLVERAREAARALAEWQTAAATPDTATAALTAAAGADDDEHAPADTDEPPDLLLGQHRINGHLDGCRMQHLELYGLEEDVDCLCDELAAELAAEAANDFDDDRSDTAP